MAYGTLNAGTITPGSGNTLAISEAVTVPTPTATTHAATKAYVDSAATQATTAAQGVGTGDTPQFAGLNAGDGNITNVGNIALDTISSDAGTSIGVTLGTDAGDDFNVGSGKLVVEGDTGLVGIGTATPYYYLDVVHPTSGAAARFKNTDGVSGQDFVAFGFSSSACGGIERSGTSQTPVFFAASDRRIKTNIQNVNPVLENLLQVRVVSADLKQVEDGKLVHGVIAQELTELFPTLVKQTDSGQGEELPEGVESWTVSDNWSYILIKAIQELSAKVTALENA
jgi:hypothetical protein